MRKLTRMAWRSMLYRCYNPKAPNYHKYGAKGVTVCKRWHKWENFLADMGLKPPGHSLDRINNKKGYSPSNCRWATSFQQNRNMSTNRKAPSGELWIDIAAKHGISPQCLGMRVHKYGWSWEKASTTPPKSRSGDIKRAIEASGVSRSQYYRRIRQSLG